MRLAVFEIIDKIEKANSEEEKIKLLQDNDSILIRKILQLAYDPNVVTFLPKEEPPYTPSQIKGAEEIMYREHRKIDMFVKGGQYDNMNQTRRERLFIELIESIDPREAKILIHSIIHRVPFKNLELDTIKEAWPGFMG